jgi:acetyl-CoA synthetase
MSMLDYKTYEEAKEKFTIEQIWELFDGTPERFNLGHECVDRHRGKGIGVRIQFDDGHREEYTFDELSRRTAQFAHVLESLGVAKGDRVAVMIDPSLDFYVCLYGILKRGAIFVPCFTAFGPEALEWRMKDSGAKLLVTTPKLAAGVDAKGAYRVVSTDGEFRRLMAAQEETYTVADTAAKDVAVLQYTSGTTRKFPQAIPHHHKSVPLLMPAAVFGRGYRFGDRFFCPASPAWGHGLWHGTLSPMALGVAVGSYSGKFNVQTLLEGLEKFEIDNFGAAPTVYRMIKNSGLIDKYKLKIRKMHYTGEPMDTDTFDFFKAKFGVPPCSGYGSTEVGAVIYQYAGFPNWVAKSGSLGKPMPGLEVALIDAEGKEVPQGQIGEIAIRRRGKWLRARDAGVVDEDGYFWHKGRVDDIIISAGWTISPTEVEDCLTRHPMVKEAAVIGAPDAERGQIVKAFVVPGRPASAELEKEIREFVRANLSKHEYPRVIEFVSSLPKTDAGKVNKKVLK